MTRVSRISFRNLICCPFIRFAKFRAKLDMLSIFPQPKFQIWHTWGLRALCTGPRPKQKMRFRPPETPFSSETDGFHQIDDTHDESIDGNFMFGSIVFDFWDFFSRRGSSLTSPPFFLERNYGHVVKPSFMAHGNSCCSCMSVRQFDTIPVHTRPGGSSRLGWARYERLSKLTRVGVTVTGLYLH